MGRVIKGVKGGLVGGEGNDKVRNSGFISS